MKEKKNLKKGNEKCAVFTIKISNFLFKRGHVVLIKSMKINVNQQNSLVKLSCSHFYVEVSF